MSNNYINKLLNYSLTKLVNRKIIFSQIPPALLSLTKKQTMELIESVTIYLIDNNWLSWLDLSSSPNLSKKMKKYKFFHFDASNSSNGLDWLLLDKTLHYGKLTLNKHRCIHHFAALLKYYFDLYNLQDWYLQKRTLWFSMIPYADCFNPNYIIEAFPLDILFTSAVVDLFQIRWQFNSSLINDFVDTSLWSQCSSAPVSDILSSTLSLNTFFQNSEISEISEIPKISEIFDLEFNSFVFWHSFQIYQGNALAHSAFPKLIPSSDFNVYSPSCSIQKSNLPSLPFNSFVPVCFSIRILLTCFLLHQFYKNNLALSFLDNEDFVYDSSSNAHFSKLFDNKFGFVFDLPLKPRAYTVSPKSKAVLHFKIPDSLIHQLFPYVDHSQSFSPQNPCTARFFNFNDPLIHKKYANLSHNQCLQKKLKNIRQLDT